MDNDSFLEKCGKCNITLRSLEEAAEHRNQHKSSKNHKETLFNCPICRISFQQVTKLLKHMDEVSHYGRICGICQKKVETDEDLVQHLEIHRTPGRPFSCEFCEAKFRSTRSLGLHIPKHTDNLPFICSICQRGFKWKQVLKKHMMTHSDETIFKCTTCDFNCKYKSTMKTHQNRHLGTSFSCSKPGCTFSTARETNLREHVKKHSKEKEFVCSKCPKKFSQKKNLIRHMQAHSETLPMFICPFCDIFTSHRKDKVSAHIKFKHPEMQNSEIPLIQGTQYKYKVANPQHRPNENIVKQENPLEVSESDFSSIATEVDDSAVLSPNHGEAKIEGGDKEMPEELTPNRLLSSDANEEDPMEVCPTFEDEKTDIDKCWQNYANRVQVLQSTEKQENTSQPEIIDLTIDEKSSLNTNNIEWKTVMKRKELCMDTFKFINPPNVTVTESLVEVFSSARSGSSSSGILSPPHLEQLSSSDVAAILNHVTDGTSIQAHQNQPLLPQEIDTPCTYSLTP